MDPLKMYFPLKMSKFQCYVSLVEVKSKFFPACVALVTIFEGGGDAEKKVTHLKVAPSPAVEHTESMDVLYFQSVDGQNPAPPRMMIIPLFIRF